jgi:UDP-N-acetylenolpyruvoylglucosamine reductase
MQLGWIRAFVLVAVAALFWNAECYGNCYSTVCGSADTQSDSCHRHQKSSHDDARCPYQHSEFASPEGGIAKISLAIGTLNIPVLAVDSIAVFRDSKPLIQADTGPPPGGDLSSTISVLRI